ncbi:MAG: hypothetical protein A2927_03350 [Candidatus Komeilibacteria bacterium RIFCSPLOWO2_01_FULL_45_10]|uniref:3D domain-containing protein n=1 Tax=Candidatus Komeilibacteria bacterium RIFCSPLOWO2_01_FULL_45_10 TaxID=1798550 RepID=A0A1G2BKJ0_9BACT|nr:MAG: hypothetical protein A2927_03350 [Candidatus Komeilibacteria bacterium RIFCSPLOWO2_01_FULL_45_10]
MLKIARKIAKNTLIFIDKILPIYLIMVVFSLSFPHLTFAQSLDPLALPQLPLDAGKDEFLKSYVSPVPRLPLDLTGQKREPRFELKIWVTAYNSHPSQTDSTPCLTASGLNVCQRATLGAADVMATNFRYLPFGTQVELPELYPGKIFIVEDRMNSRYWRVADIWMSDFEEAKNFGRKWTTVKIY